jgi:hypothetical protein
MLWSLNIDQQIELIKIVGGGIAFGFGLRQYRSAQTWKRLEFVAEQTDAFFKNESVQNVLLMLDWNGRDLDLFHDGKTLNVVNYEILEEALKIHEEKPGGHFTDVEAAIRDEFDVFLGGLTKFENFIEAGLITAEDVRPYIEYWVKVLSGQKGGIVRSMVLQRFWEYVDYYDQSPVRSLLSRYAILPSTLDRTQIPRRALAANR